MNRSNLVKLFGAATLAFFTATATGCGPSYDHIDINPVQGQGVLDDTISKQELVLAEGLVLTANVVPWNDDNEKMPLAIVSMDPSIVEIAGVVNDRNYSFIGKRQGSTQIQFKADGDTVLTIRATVVPQPAQ